MKALIYKDLYNTVVNGAIFMILAWYGWLTFNDIPLEGKIPLTMLAIIFAPLGRDDRFRTDSLYCSFPVTRKDIVLSRYISVFVMVGIVALISVITHVFLNPGFLSGTSSADRVGELGTGLFFMAVFISVLYPIYFKFGARMEEAKWTLLISVILIFLFLGAAAVGLTILNVRLSEIRHINLYRMVLIPVLLSVSIGLSLVFYKKREF